VHVAIVGNGVTGVSAALRLRARRPDWRITLLSGESTHHWSRPALMYVYMGHMRYADTKPFPDSFWGEQRLELLRGWVTRIDLGSRRLELAGQPPLHWDKLLLATGARSNRFGWPGEELAGVQGLYGLADLRALHETCARARAAVIVGGGLIGVELAEMLRSRALAVTVLVREASYWRNALPAEESELVERAIRAHGVELRPATELARVLDDGAGRCAGVETTRGERIACELVGLTAGVRPNVALVAGTPVRVGRGVLVDRMLRTSVPDVFAAGDCAELERPDGTTLVQQLWYTGKLQGEHVADVMAGDERAYEPGLAYNSAKFFDLEFQTYGDVPATAGPGNSLYWQDEGGRHALRIAHVGGRVTGFNALGLRWRHAVAERWIAEGRPLAHVLAHLSEAHFDPELHRRHERALADAFARQLAGEGARPGAHTGAA